MPPTNDDHLMQPLLDNAFWTVPMREYLLTVVNGNDRRLTDILGQLQRERDIEKECVREIIESNNQRTADRFTALESVKAAMFHEYHGLLDAQDIKIAQRFTALENVKTALFHEYHGLLTGLEDKTDQRFAADREFVMARLQAIETQIIALIQGVKESITAALVSANAAIAKAEATSDKRFDGVNEFRAALSDQQRTLIPRQEVQVTLKAIEDKIATNTESINNINNKVSAVTLSSAAKHEGTTQGWGYAVGVIGLVSVIISIIFGIMGHMK